jgi:hypothetical protein
MDCNQRDTSSSRNTSISDEYEAAVSREIRPAERHCYVTKLPTNLLRELTTYISYKDFVYFASTCTRFSALLTDEYITWHINFYGEVRSEDIRCVARLRELKQRKVYVKTYVTDQPEISGMFHIDAEKKMFYSLYDGWIIEGKLENEAVIISKGIKIDGIKFLNKRRYLGEWRNYAYSNGCTISVKGHPLGFWYSKTNTNLRIKGHTCSFHDPMTNTKLCIKTKYFSSKITSLRMIRGCLYAVEYAPFTYIQPRNRCIYKYIICEGQIKSVLLLHIALKTRSLDFIIILSITGLLQINEKKSRPRVHICD